MSVAKIIEYPPGRCPVSLQVSKGVYAPCSQKDAHEGPHKSSDGLEFETHPAGCACGPCHNERIGERTQPRQDTPEGACGIRDGASGRVCLRESGHAGLHMTGYRFFADPLPEEPKKARAKKPATAKVPAKKGAPKKQDAGSDLAKAGYCAATFYADAPKNQRVCTLAAGHDGPHKNTSVGIIERPTDTRPKAQRCFCGGKDGTAKPHDLGEPVICRIPNHDMCMCESGNEQTHMLGAPGCEAPPMPRPITLEDEPEDPEADTAALAAMDAQDRGELDDDLTDEGDDPYEDEVRSDEDRAFARQQREAREAHAAEIEAEHAPATTGPLTKIGNYEVHPAAALFPMIDEAEYPAFRDDIGANGQRKRIVRIKGLILDGRNRLRACLDLGVEPKFREFGEEASDGTDPIAFVISENVRRRHLNETQRAFVGAELVPMYEEQAKERQRGALKQNAGTVSPNSGSRDKGKATELAARAVNVGKTSVEAALKVKRDAAPEVLAASKDRGALAVSAAAKLAKLPKQKQREIIEKVDSKNIRAGKVGSLVKQEEKREVIRRINRGLVAPMPVGQFGVIYGDYPWKYDNSDQHEGSRGHMGYPPMEMDEILAHAREAAKRAAKDCIIALWVTNLHIPNIGRVIEAYGAEHHTMLTWPKPRAGVGTWPRGQTEHVVIASIGAPVHTLNEISTLLPSWQPAHPGEHSSKPAELGPLLAQHCGGPFLELFARDQREGWTCWGAEVDKFATEAA